MNSGSGVLGSVLLPPGRGKVRESSPKGKVSRWFLPRCWGRLTATRLSSWVGCRLATALPKPGSRSWGRSRNAKLHREDQCYLLNQVAYLSTFDAYMNTSDKQVR